MARTNANVITPELRKLKNTIAQLYTSCEHLAISVNMDGTHPIRAPEGARGGVRAWARVCESMGMRAWARGYGHAGVGARVWARGCGHAGMGA